MPLTQTSRRTGVNKVDAPGERDRRRLGESEYTIQPLWRTSPGASMSVYQTAFWDRDVTARGQTYIHAHTHARIDNFTLNIYNI